MMNNDKLSAIKDFSEYNYTHKFEIDKYGKFGSVAPLFGIFRCLKICNLEFGDRNYATIATSYIQLLTPLLDRYSV